MDPNILRSKAKSETLPMCLVLALVGKFCLCPRESFVLEGFICLFLMKVLSILLGSFVSVFSHVSVSFIASMELRQK